MLAIAKVAKPSASAWRALSTMSVILLAGPVAPWKMPILMLGTPV